ncbi:unnamed protein product [Allacma fusca]|uniref:Ribosomal RNA large subunit methyltransferase K/L-like methyltransferase domain-containing protein n=1 Tax=Allacma fusca TaxID=39272 RepID=A0A8J2JXH2_9HEXA|nr:unnamed protein product [Allacma fusca]
MSYFITHGQGLEPFVRRELSGQYHRSFDDLDIHVEEVKFPGKIVFSAKPQLLVTPTKKDGQNDPTQATNVLIQHLKTVERLFGLLFFESDISGFLEPGRNALSGVYDYVAGKVSTFSIILDNWAEYLVSAESDKRNLRKEVLGEEVEGADLRPKRRKESHSFRVNVRISGKFRALNHRAVTKCIGSALVKNLPKSANWVINLKRPTVEISFYLTDEGVICGIPLCKLPLSERSYLNKIPLRSTIAYCMASLAVEGEDSDEGTLIALDPMCGSSTILVELVKHFPQVLFAAGIDISTAQAEEAFLNAGKAEELSKIVVLVSDSSLTLPFKSEMSFDCILCDLPFGIQHLTRDEVTALLPKVFKNFNLIIKTGGNIVLLLSSEMSELCENILHELKVTWEIVEKYPVKLGELPAIIYHYKKVITAEPNKVSVVSVSE